MTATRREVRHGDHGWTRHILAGAAGAVEYHAYPGRAVGIEFHSPRPMFGGDVATDKCDVLEGPCYPDGNSTAAHVLREQWANAGRDDEVIWRELESRYDEMFAEPVTTKEA
jgi:hypothetical protein